MIRRVDDLDAAHEALRAWCHERPDLDDPSTIYATFGSITRLLGPLTQIVELAAESASRATRCDDGRPVIGAAVEIHTRDNSRQDAQRRERRDLPSPFDCRPPDLRRRRKVGGQRMSETPDHARQHVVPPPGLVDPPAGYAEWLAELKSRVYAAQQRSALAVNSETLRVYWQIGREILARREVQGWGRKITERLSHDLRVAFPDMRGFSRTNLDYMRAFASAWPADAISQQAVGKLPWGHNLVLLNKLASADDRLRYAVEAVRHGWSRNVLTIQIERGALERQGKAITNFESTIPARDTDLARESLKDPYRLDFLGRGDESEERAVEKALVEHVTEFLLELGAGFAFVGR